MGRKRIVTMTLISLAVLILAAAAAMIIQGKTVTVARCIVTENGAVLMVHGGSPVRLHGETPDGIYTGDLLFILRDGAIAQSYPGQTGSYFAVKLIKGDSSNVPADIIGSLESLGYHIIFSADTPPSVYTQLTVTEITSDHLLLSDEAGSRYSVPNWFSPSVEVEIGNSITVHHNGEIKEIYPAAFTKIYRMTLKKADGCEVSVLPAMRGY